MRQLAASPRLAAVLRDWLGGGGSPALREQQRDAERATLPWVTATLAAGQEIGAVRRDIPSDLLVLIVMGLGQALDSWLITRPVDDLEAAVAMLMATLRRAIAPG